MFGHPRRSTRADKRYTHTTLVRAAPRLADLDELVDPGQLGLRGDRAHVGVVVERIADAQRGHPALEAFEDLVGHALLHEQAASGTADVALVEEDAVEIGRAHV